MEKRDLFRFQNFDIDQSNAPFKVGTDGVLLAAWVRCENRNSILEIGSGTGVISAIVVQRTQPEKLQTVELNPTASRLTQENLGHLLSNEAYGHFEGDWLDFVQQQSPSFELILCNPPYFENAYLSRDREKNTARHTQNLSLRSLLIHAQTVIGDNGILAVVIPIGQVEQYGELARSNGWYIQRMAKVRNRPDSPFKRALVEYSRKPQPEPEATVITLRNTRNEYSTQYLEIVKGLYLFA